MKRVILLLTALLSFICSASATDIHSITTEVWLYKNGNALVYQIWDVNVTQGTEWYIPIENLGQRDIRDLRVFENNRRFEDDGRSWDSNRTLEQKKYRCGIVEKANGVELCWGQGDYGHHVYQILYIIDNLVQRTADDENNAFNWCFVNEDLPDAPDSVSLTFCNKIDSSQVWVAGREGNMGVWVFGCEADYRLENGDVIIESTEPLLATDRLSVLMRFDRDLFDPNVTDDRTFSEIMDEAFEDSNYYPEDGGRDTERKFRRFLLWFAIIIIGIPLCIFILPALIEMWFRKVTGRRYDKTVFGRDRIDGWYRTVPLGGRLDAAYSLLATGDKLSWDFKLFPQMVGAYFLRWVQQGLVSAQPDPIKEGRMNLQFTSDYPKKEFEDPMERSLYTSARSAAGKNLLLESDEFNKWSENNYERVLGWQDYAKTSGAEVWNDLSVEERCHLAEFRNFLDNFTLSDERSVPEVGVWQEYLVFAQLFGIAEKVSKSFEKLYPNLYADYAAKSNLTDAAASYEVIRGVGKSSSRFVDAASNKKSEKEAEKRGGSSSGRYYGGGGHSSRSGGGGYSGGGRGGGSR